MLLTVSIKLAKSSKMFDLQCCIKLIPSLKNIGVFVLMLTVGTIETRNSTLETYPRVALVISSFSYIAIALQVREANMFACRNKTKYKFERSGYRMKTGRNI